MQNIEIEFDRRKLNRSINETAGQTFELREARTGLLITLSFEAKEIYDMWRIAHARPLELFEDMVQKLAAMNSPGACVVVCGGSSRHSFMKSAIRKACAQSGMAEDSEIWIDKIAASDP